MSISSSVLSQSLLLLGLAHPVVHLDGVVVVKPLLQLIHHLRVEGDVAQRLIYQVRPSHSSPSLPSVLLLTTALVQLQFLDELINQLTLHLSRSEFEEGGVEENATHQPLLLPATGVCESEADGESAFGAFDTHRLHQEEALSYLCVDTALADHPKGSLNIVLFWVCFEEKVALFVCLDEAGGLMEGEEWLIAFGARDELLLCLFETQVDALDHYPLIYQVIIKHLKKISDKQQDSEKRIKQQIHVCSCCHMKQQLCFFFCSQKDARLQFRKNLVALFSYSSSAIRTNSSSCETGSPSSLPIIVSKTKLMLSPFCAEVSMQATCSSFRKDQTQVAQSHVASWTISALLARRRTSECGGACSRKRVSQTMRLRKDSLRGVSNTRSAQLASRRQAGTRLLYFSWPAVSQSWRRQGWSAWQGCYWRKERSC